MRVFMTGATGYLGSAVGSALVNAGHEVTALARPGSRRRALETAGIRVVDGSLESIRALGSMIAKHDAFVHAASAGGDNGPLLDAEAIDVGVGMAHAGGVFVYTSGVWVFGDTGGRVVDESSPVNPLPRVAWRPGHERRVLDAASEDFATAVVRPGCIYGAGQSLLRQWFDAAERGTALEIVDQGTCRWALAYLDDVADCYLRVIEQRASGVFHSTDDSHATVVEMARAVAESAGRGSEIRMIPLDQARRNLGSLADALAVDQIVSSRATREALGWEPSCPSFLDSIERQWAEWDEAKDFR